MKRTPKLLMALLLAVAMLAASCGSDGDTDDGSTADAAEAPDVERSDDDIDDEAMDEEASDEATDDGETAAVVDDVTLTWWTFGGSGHDNLVAEFEAANPGVTVEVIVSGFDEHHEKLLAGFVSGEVPDVALVEVGYSSLFKANPSNFTDLRDYGAGDLADEFIPFRWEHGVAPDGTVVGLPTDVGGLAVAYRSDLFANAGLPADPDDVTALIPDWDAFLDLGDEFVANTPDGGTFIDTAGLLFESIVKQGPEGFYSTGGELIYDTSPHVAEAWRLANSAIERDLSANLGAFSPEWNAAMANGDHAVQLAPAWMMNYIAGQAPDTAGNWRIAEFPGGGGNWGGSQLTIPAEAPNADLAWELISFISTEQGHLSIFEDFGNFPSIQSLFDNEDVLSFENEHFGGQQVGRVYAASILSVEPQFEGIDQRTMLREFTGAIGEIENGNLTSDEAWQTALDNIGLEIG